MCSTDSSWSALGRTGSFDLPLGTVARIAGLRSIHSQLTACSSIARSTLCARLTVAGANSSLVNTPVRSFW